MELRLCIRILLLLWLAFLCKPLFANDIEVIDVDINSQLNRIEASLKTNPNLARNLALKAKQDITKNNLPEAMPRLLNLQAHIEILASNLNEAFALAVESEDQARRIGDKLQLAEAIRRQGIINNFLGFDADAIERLTESLKIHRQLKSKYIVNNLQSIANVYSKNSNWLDSVQEIGEAMVEEAIAIQNTYFEEQGYGLIIHVLTRRGEHLKASQLADEMEVHFGTDTYDVLYYGAIAELNLGNYEKALTKINKYIAIAQRRNFLPVQIAAKLRKTEILMAAGRETEAKQLMYDALASLEETSYDSYKKEVVEQLAFIYQKQGDYAKALEYYQRYTEFKEREFDDKQDRQLAFSRARLELEQKNQRITELELSQTISDQKNNFQMVVIGLAGSIVVILLALYWRLINQRRLLLKTTSQLKRATEAKSDFLARMSHEIRTPINAIIGLTKLTRKQQLSEHQQDVNLQQIEDSSQTLLGVINDILDFSKIEAGKLNIESLAFELDKVVDQSTRLQTLKAHEKGLELVQYIPRDIPLHLKGDALRLQQVLNNLISNAVKFTRKGEISVSVEKKYAESGVLLQFSVKDTGIGMSKDQIARLFDSFSQADESTTRKFGGTGLGLAICKQLVELMGGDIWVESHPGKGSIFYFTLPVEELEQSTKEVPGVQLADLRVLVVDDVELCRQAAAEVLMRVSINPDLADSGAQAVEKVRLSVENKTPYDMILLDWQMPDIDGIHVAAMINQQFPRTKHNIVMLSAHDMQTLKESGEPLGIRGYLEKPVNTGNMLEVITELTQFYKPDIRATKKLETKQEPDLRGINILLVEDNALNRKVALGFLSETKASVSIAEDGQIAVAMVTAEPDKFDLILMDLQMPVMDGYSATQKIRNELQLTMPIVAMTANAMKDDVEKCKTIGMDAHVPKPIDPDKLNQTLEKLLHHKITAIKNGPAQSLEDAFSHKNSDQLAINGHQNKPFGEQTVSDQTVPELNGKRLLLVEDNKLSCKVAIGLLAETNAHISVAKDGERALEMLTKHPHGFDLVFMDVQMPGMGGNEATKVIRNKLQLSLPIIAMTASTGDSDVAATKQAGMDAHISKPIDPDVLYAVIRRFLSIPDHKDKTDTSPFADDDTELLKVNQQLAIEKLKGNAELYEGLVEDFIGMKPQLNDLIGELRHAEASEECNFSHIKRLVHTYKSALAYIGANNLSGLGLEIEHQLHDNGEVLSSQVISSMQKYTAGIAWLTSELEGKHN